MTIHSRDGAPTGDDATTPVFESAALVTIDVQADKTIDASGKPQQPAPSPK